MRSVCHIFISFGRISTLYALFCSSNSLDSSPLFIPKKPFVWLIGHLLIRITRSSGIHSFSGYCRVNVQGGPKVGIQLLNYFLCALKLPAVHFMWPKSRYTVNGENYLEILREVVVPQLQTKPDFDELFFQQDGAPPH